MSQIERERSPLAGAVPYSRTCGKDGPDSPSLRIRGLVSLGVRMGVAFSLTLTPLFAHDMWIEPKPFFPEAGQVVSLGLRVGQNLLGDPLPLDPALVNEFLVEDAAGRRPVLRRDGADPAGLLRVATPGLLVIGYLSNPSAIELPALRFDQYLKDEGLDAIAAMRAGRGSAGATVREHFSRCAKSLVLLGPPRDAAGDRQLGFVLELVAERNPYALRAGEDLPVRLTYERRPLPGALVVAMNRSSPSDKQAARTDKDGRVRFHIRPGGLWLIKAVHMIPAPAGANAEWASFWASLTFEMPGPDGGRRPRVGDPEVMSRVR